MHEFIPPLLQKGATNQNAKGKKGQMIRMDIFVMYKYLLNKIFLHLLVIYMYIYI